LTFTTSLEIYTLSLHDALPIFERLFPPADGQQLRQAKARLALNRSVLDTALGDVKDLRRQLGSIDQQRLDQYLDSVRDVEQRLRSEEHTSELQSRENLVCRLLL